MTQQSSRSVIPPLDSDMPFLPEAIFSEDIVLIAGEEEASVRAIALAFSACGAGVVLASSDTDMAARIANQVLDLGEQAHAISLGASPADVLNFAREKLGAVTIFIDFSSGPLASALIDDWVKNDRAGIVALCRPRADHAGDAEAQSGLSKSAGRLKPCGGRINMISFSHLEGAAPPQTPDLNEEATRIGTFHELGWAAAFLCSPFAAHITGQTLALDGGASAARPALVEVSS